MSPPKPLSPRAAHGEPPLGRLELAPGLRNHDELRREKGGDGEQDRDRTERPQQNTHRDCNPRRSNDHAAQ